MKLSNGIGVEENSTNAVFLYNVTRFSDFCKFDASKFKAILLKASLR